MYGKALNGRRNPQQLYKPCNVFLVCFQLHRQHVPGRSIGHDKRGRVTKRLCSLVGLPRHELRGLFVKPRIRKSMPAYSILCRFDYRPVTLLDPRAHIMRATLSTEPQRRGCPAYCVTVTAHPLAFQGMRQFVEEAAEFCVIREATPVAPLP